MTDLEEANKNGVLVDKGLKYFFIILIILLFCWFGPMIFMAISVYK